MKAPCTLLQASVRCQSPSSREHMDSIATDLAEFYRCRPFEELRVPILVTPEAVEGRILW